MSLDNKTIYEIFRACRLCGGGGGYKMPIIPTVASIDNPIVDLCRKIRECVQLEVNQDDKMPPLICEVCVNKVNDFYEFIEMCKETNRKTRLRLGLPLETAFQDSQAHQDSGDCILGMTEQVYTTEAAPAPLRVKVDRQKENEQRVRSLRKELEKLIKQENLTIKSVSSNTADRKESYEMNQSNQTRTAFNSGQNKLHSKSRKSQPHEQPTVFSPAKPQSLLAKVRELIVEDDDPPSLLTPKKKKPKERSQKEKPIRVETPDIRNVTSRIMSLSVEESSRPGPARKKVEIKTLAAKKEYSTKSRRESELDKLLKSQPEFLIPSQRSRSKVDECASSSDSRRPSLRSPASYDTGNTIKLRHQEQQSQKQEPRNMLKAAIENKLVEIVNDEDEDDLPIMPSRSKRQRDTTDGVNEDSAPEKRVKIIIKLPKRPPTPGPGVADSEPKKFNKPCPKSKKKVAQAIIDQEEKSQGPIHTSTTCDICGVKCKTIQAKISHMKKHTIPAPAIQLKLQRRSPTPPRPSPKSKKIFSRLEPIVRLEPAPAPPPPTPPAAPPAPRAVCLVCGQGFKSNVAKTSHQRTHLVTYTQPSVACNSCCEWFTTSEEAAKHHRGHETKRKMYKCRGCSAKYKKYTGLLTHIEETKCLPFKELPDIQCPDCPEKCPTMTLYNEHKKICVPIYKCKDCNKVFGSKINLRKHCRNCKFKEPIPAPKPEAKPKTPVARPETSVSKAKTVLSKPKIASHIKRRLKKLEIRLRRCDAVLKMQRNRKYNVADVCDGYDLDKKCYYPYRPVTVKTEPFDVDRMVRFDTNIQRDLYKEEDYVHWDSDNSDSSDDEYSLLNSVKIRAVPSLSALSLKTLFSRRCIGKVPRKLRKVKSKLESKFDDFEIAQNDINNILGVLTDDVEKPANIGSNSVNITVNDDNNGYDSDSLLDDQVKTVNKVYDFDSIFKSDTYDSVMNNVSSNGDKREVVDNNTDASLDGHTHGSIKGNDEDTTSELSREFEKIDGKTTEDTEVNNTDSNVTNSNNIDDRNDTNESTDVPSNNVGSLGTDLIGDNESSNNVDNKSDQEEYIDAKKLLEELDEHIGENGTTDTSYNDNEKDKIDLGLASDRSFDLDFP